MKTPIDEAECRHGLVTEDCTLCNGRTPAPAPMDVGPTFTARFDGHCEWCGHRIYIDDRVHYVDDTLKHERC